MKGPKAKRVKPGCKVKLTRVPPGLLDDLPEEDQRAILEIVGKPVLLASYDADGRAELEFTDADGVIHFIYVNLSYPLYIRK